ncbi:hypothetical protein NFI96_003905 [Prochilodus magdalenae]|nr:hypothetical protein NFI96_003905 [Prochilodus magdalenae]
MMGFRSSPVVTCLHLWSPVFTCGDRALRKLTSADEEARKLLTSCRNQCPKQVTRVPALCMFCCTNTFHSVPGHVLSTPPSHPHPFIRRQACGAVFFARCQ